MRSMKFTGKSGTKSIKEIKESVNIANNPECAIVPMLS